MRRTCYLLALLAALAGCGPTPDPRSPAAIHSAWVSALHDNQRAAAQALVAEDAALDVDRALEQAQYLVQHPPTGAGQLVAVDIEPPHPRGAGQVGRSRWRLERLTSCFVTTLAATPAGWRVTGWAERATGCPSATGGQP